MKRKILFSILIVFILSIVLSAAVYAATYILNMTSGNKPTWLSPGWRFWAKSDTYVGQGVCVEVHPQGDGGNYVKTACVYDDTGNPPANYRCDVFTSGVPSAFYSKTVEYQFFNADYGACTSNTTNYTGFIWTFTTGTTAVTLSSLTARSGATFPVALLVGAVVVTGGVAIWRKRK